MKHDTASQYTVADLEAGISLPLFDRNQGNILSAQAELVAARQELRRVELSLRDRLAEVSSQYANARHQVDVFTQSILPSAKSSLELASAGFREGEFGFLELLKAQRTYFDASLSYLRGLRELR